MGNKCCANPCNGIHHDPKVQISSLDKDKSETPKAELI